ncbi:MAG TPA: hypothetical protein VNY05_11665 [Candidatus Acidoferrales bacterium]|jgi:hypothetical protein|nr:hypothetical protein [Candidatus Acidoferrales bacterium]
MRVTPHGAWYRCPYAEEEIDRLVRQFSAGADQLLLPVPLDFLASQLDAEVPAIETAVRLTGECRLFSGYVARMPLGTRAPRAIRLHRILSGGRVGEVAPARQLLELYRSEFADDACTLFDVEATMSSFPHLFLRLGDLGWARIGAAGSRKTAPEGSGEDEVGFHRWSDERRSLNQARNRELLLQILKEHGLGGIPKIARLLTMKCGNQFSVASATACLYSSGDFVHYAPGIYGLFDETWHVCRDPEARKLLLNRRACIEYILARWAGEPAGAYPLWTPEMEVDWCEWAESRAKPLLGSLLAVVDPSSWPISESYRNIWLWKKECWEYYRFETPPSYPLAEVPLIGLLAVLRCARWRGGLNWVLASRVTGDSIIRRATAAYMALLIGVEAIVPAAHWQRWHNVSPEAGAIDSMLSDELHRKGSLGWDGAAGQDLLKRLEKSMDRRETGWLSGPELHRLIVNHTSKAAATPSK